MALKNPPKNYECTTVETDSQFDQQRTQRIKKIQIHQFMKKKSKNVKKFLDI